MNPFIVTDETRFDALETAWSTLHRKSTGATFFQSFEACRAWWNLEGRELGTLFLLGYGSVQQIQTLLPTWIDPQGRLRFFMSGKGDILGALHDGPIRLLLSNLMKMKEKAESSDKVVEWELGNLRRQDKLIDLLPVVFRDHFLWVCQHDCHSWLSREDYSPSRYLASIPSKLYIKLKKADSRLQSQAKIFESEAEPFPASLVHRLLGKMSAAGLRDINLFEKIVPMMREFYRLRALIFIAQEYRGETISMTALIRLDERTLMGWIDLYDPAFKTANIKNYLHILSYCRQKNLDFDMGTGLYDYKLRNFSPHIESLMSVYATSSRSAFFKYHMKKGVAKLLRKIP